MNGNFRAVPVQCRCLALRRGDQRPPEPKEQQRNQMPARRLVGPQSPFLYCQRGKPAPVLARMQSFHKPFPKVKKVTQALGRLYVFKRISKLQTCLDLVSTKNCIFLTGDNGHSYRFQEGKYEHSYKFDVLMCASQLLRSCTCSLPRYWWWWWWWWLLSSTCCFHDVLPILRCPASCEPWNFASMCLEPQIAESAMPVPQHPKRWNMRNCAEKCTLKSRHPLHHCWPWKKNHVKTKYCCPVKIVDLCNILQFICAVVINIWPFDDVWSLAVAIYQTWRWPRTWSNSAKVHGHSRTPKYLYFARVKFQCENGSDPSFGLFNTDTLVERFFSTFFALIGNRNLQSTSRTLFKLQFMHMFTLCHLAKLPAN